VAAFADDGSAYGKVVRLRRLDEIAERMLRRLVARERDDFKVRCLKRMIYCAEKGLGARRRVWNLVWAKLCQQTEEYLGIEYMIVPAGDGLWRWLISGGGHRAAALVKGDEALAATACRLVIETLHANAGAAPAPRGTVRRLPLRSVPLPSASTRTGGHS
jgi:hypothetical protein